ncbi:MAG TPA: hypothetical protein IGS40_23685 [Trichormus sp. M33_DOE_039]|nr:hypothetical protein [Trichormus sp. M33_DOE_039]
MLSNIDEADFEYTTTHDKYFNYCLWPYTPVAPVENKFRAVNLLFNSFKIAGIDKQALPIVQSIREEIGLFQTVWGIKWLGNRLVWEFYFYDYQRRERNISMQRVLEAIAPYIRCNVSPKDNFPYFMFSLDIDAELVAGTRPLETIHMYIGNPGSTVSSGIAYAISDHQTQLENFYFFFNTAQQLSDVASKICCSAHVDCQQIDIYQILWTELQNCQTICLANKQKCDTIYFSGINVDQLLIFLTKLGYPTKIIEFVKTNRVKLSHLLYDVGFDYRAEEKNIVILKSGYYGIF